MTTDLDTAVQYYKDLILYQYANSPKAIATIGLLAEQGLIELVELAVNQAYDLDTAQGVNLDMIGIYIGLSRITPTQTDLEYKQLLTLKNVLNYSDNTMYSINTFLNLFFGNDIICIDQKDMTLVYFVNNTLNTLMQIALQNNLVPKPMGVKISGAFAIGDPTKLFAFCDYEWDNGYNTGFSDYTTGFNDRFWLNYSDRINL